MKFIAWGMNKSDVQEQRAAIQKDHWAFWDAYDSRLIARGPFLNPDNMKSAVGNVHIAELKDWEEARTMAHEEPYYRGGIFEWLRLSHFSLELGRSQFEIPARPEMQGYFVHCPAANGVETEQPALEAAHQAYCEEHDDLFACRGALYTEDGAWDGTIFMLEVADGDALSAFLEAEPYRRAGLLGTADIQYWRRGGRANAPGK